MKYTTPEIEILKFEDVDVIRTSSDEPTPPVTGGPDPGKEGLEIL